MKVRKTDGAITGKRCAECGKVEDIFTALNSYDLCPMCNRLLFPYEDMRDED